MKSVILFSVLVTLSIVSCTRRQGSDIRTGALEVLVTESHLPLVQRLVADYGSVYPEVAISPRGTSTRAALVDMINDSVHCVIVDRRMNDEERNAAAEGKLTVIETEIARDGLAVLVHPSNNLSSLSMETIRRILSGETGLWNSIPESKTKGVIELCLTGKNSGMYELLTRHFFRLEKEASLAAIATSQQGIIDYVAAHPEGIGIISYAVWRDTSRTDLQSVKRKVRMLDLLAPEGRGGEGAVQLSQRNIYDRTYPLTYSLFMYTSERTPGAAYGFSAFVAGDVGQRVFLYAGLVPKIMPYRTIQLTQESM